MAAPAVAQPANNVSHPQRQHLQKPNNKLNLKSLDGLRCIACVSIILLHTHYFFGALFFPYPEACMQTLANLPILGPLFFNNSFQMPLFWILSGFLCEFQLDRLVQKNHGAVLTRADYGRFLFNRWLRLYPLYFLFNMINYVVQSSSDEGTGKCNDTTKLMESLFFVLKSEPLPAAACAGAGWSVMVDVHGYFALVFLHAFYSENTKRKLVLPGLYAGAIAYMGFHAWKFLQDKELVSYADVSQMFRGAVYSLQYQNDQDLVLVKVMSGINVRDLWSDRYEFGTDFWDQIVSLRHEILDSNYFASVHKNGSSIFLGSLLYLNMKQRLSRQGTAASSPLTAMAKLAAAVAILELSSYSWMFSGLPVYLFVDAVLSMTQGKIDDPKSPADRWSLFSNPIWMWMSPYTYGIYMVHVFVLVISTGPIYKHRAARMLAGETIHYSIPFLIAAVLFVLAISWVCAVALYNTVEWPARYYRTRYTSSAAVVQAPKKID